MNIIIITIDCLRNSQLSYQGYKRKTTPFMDNFTYKFKAISTSPWTYPSVTSILTGLYPHNHNAYVKGKNKNFDNLKNFQKINRNILTLPEIFFMLGHRVYFGTAIDMALYPFKNRVIPKTYFSLNAEHLLSDLKKWISRDKTPFFAYLQLGDIHEPLSPPKKFYNFFGIVKNIPNVQRWDFRSPKEFLRENFEEYKKNRILLYDNTLRYIDYSLEQFNRYLEQTGLADNTIFIITADHGEEFWEHAKLEANNFFDPRGYYGVGHGHNVFNEIIEVPLLFSLPDDHMKITNHLISGVDITPTILELMDIDYNQELDGFNVFKIKQGRPILTEAIGYGFEKKSLIMGNYKLIYSKNDKISWLFDRKKDPKEVNPIDDKDITFLFEKKLKQIFTDYEKLKIKQV
ncbi:MAG: sulfatase, partial [Promethearchaeota archaeon]